MKPRRITMITAALNPGPEVVETIESVLGQSSPGLQYIFVDGGSRPEAFSYVEPYVPHFSHLIREPDRGISDAWNKALALAEGDIVGILNADDHLLPRALERVVAGFDASPEPLQVVHGDAIRLEGQRRCRWQPRPTSAASWYLGMPLIHPATFVARGVYRRVGGFNCQRRIAMDYDFLLRAWRAGARFTHVAEPLVVVRSGGLSDCQPLVGFGDVRISQLEAGLNRPVVEALHAARVAMRRYVRPLIGV